LAAVRRAKASPYFTKVPHGRKSGQHDYLFLIWGVPEAGEDVSSEATWVDEGGVSIDAFIELGTAVNLAGVVGQLRAAAEERPSERAVRAVERSDVYKDATLDTYNILELLVDDTTPESFAKSLLTAYDSGMFMSPLCGWVDPEGAAAVGVTGAVAAAAAAAGATAIGSSHGSHGK
jgi:hypothetical protein